MNFYFKPLMWPTIFFLFSLSILISLGVWQIQRLIWKEDLISFYNDQYQNSVIRLDESSIIPKDIEFRKVKVNGSFLNNKEIQVTGKVYEGNAGFHVITPFVMSNGKIILVNRGWVSENYRMPKTRKFSLLNENIMIEGIARLPQKKGYFVPENDPKNRFWFTIKPNEIRRYLKLDEKIFIKNFYIDILRDSKQIKLPIGIKPGINLRNQHLSYAMTWFSLAVVLIIIYISYHYSEGRLKVKRLK